MPFKHLHLRPAAAVRRLALVALGLVVAACASGPPAPVVPRTAPGTAGAQRPPEPPRGSVPPPAVVPAPAAPEVPTVQTAPVRPGAIESRGIESRPLDARPAAPGTVTPPPPPPAPVVPALPPNTRTGPRGLKVPYSDVALAELKAAEGTAALAAAPVAGAAPAASVPGAAAPAKPAEPKPAEASAEEWSWPSAGRVLQTFDESSSKGIALGGKLGDPVQAAADGRVIFSGNGPRGYGNLVIVKHANDLLSVYAHNRTLAVKEGQSVKRGQKIAELGDSGTTSAKLHFEIRQQGKPVDPMKFLPRR